MTDPALVHPPDQDAEFVWHLEDVLEVSTRPYDPTVGKAAWITPAASSWRRSPAPRPVAPGRPAREDYEYLGEGRVQRLPGASRGSHQVMVSQRRTHRLGALQQELLEVYYPDAEVVVLVQDNLNTHTPASLYEAFEPAEAKRLADRLELHYTPAHGSWLDVAEIELAVLAEQGLDRRLAGR